MASTAGVSSAPHFLQRQGMAAEVRGQDLLDEFQVGRRVVDRAETGVRVEDRPVGGEG